MNSFLFFLTNLKSIPMVTTWKLDELAQMKGHQELYTKQSPQRLQKLREYSMIESAVSSNRIEGVAIDDKRIGTVIFGKNTNLRDRNEEEVRGYRKALDLIHTQADKLPLSIETICRLHALIRPNIWDSGKFKESAGDIIETYADGSSRIRFKTVAPDQVETALTTAINEYQNTLRDNRISPLIALAAFNLDFLCIHPFRDGNGRVSRLLLLLMLYQLGYEAGRYISIEKMIESTKDRYYETLEQSSVNWHEGAHDAWPYINYLLFVLKSVYKEFESRFENTSAPRGEKSEMIINAINAFTDSFTVRQIEQQCPGVSRGLVRKIMQQYADCLKCTGRGAGAHWERIKLLSLNEATNRATEE